MSLTLARLCGEWRLVSVNYELVSENYEARGASGRKYEAQIVMGKLSECHHQTQLSIHGPHR